MTLRPSADDEIRTRTGCCSIPVAPKATATTNFATSAIQSSGPGSLKRDPTRPTLFPLIKSRDTASNQARRSHFFGVVSIIQHQKNKIFLLLI
jgi:hypothetical protein